MTAFLTKFALDVQIGFFLLSLILAYFYWIRPVLRERPATKAFYDVTESWLAALNLKFQGLKGKIATGLAKAAAVIVLLHDQLIPYATGVDWTPITGQLPGWVWPVITFAMFYFIGQAREWAEARA